MINRAARAEAVADPDREVESSLVLQKRNSFGAVTVGKGLRRRQPLVDTTGVHFSVPAPLRERVLAPRDDPTPRLSAPITPALASQLGGHS
jgi:hypothetical protein